MAVRVVTADPRVDTARGAVALERGPLVYCLEAVDQPGGFRLDDVVIDPAGAGDGRAAAGSAGWRGHAHRSTAGCDRAGYRRDGGPIALPARRPGPVQRSS